MLVTTARIAAGLVLLVVGLGFAVVGVMSMGDGTIVIVPSMIVAVAGGILIGRTLARSRSPRG